MYAIWIKVDDTLPWIELKGDYETRTEARKAACKFLAKTKIKIVKASEKRRQIKQLIMVKQ